MPKTYDQTSITYRKDKCEIYISPRPVAPANAALEDRGITRAYFYELNEIKPLYWQRVLTLYEWYPNGDIMRENDDGSTTMWHAKPTLKDAIEKPEQYHRFYSDGSCMVRYHDGVEQRTLFYGEDREVDEPDQDNWLNQSDLDLGHLHPYLIPEGWYCKKCDTSHCEHISKEKKQQLDNESP